MSKMTKQRLLGLALVMICILFVALASQGASPEERDVTPVVLLLPLGIYAMTTKKYILTDADAEPTEERNEAIQEDRMKDKSPCKDCKPPVRYPGCQSHCEIGKDYFRSQHERNELIRRERGKDKAFDCFKSERVFKTKKRLER